MTSAPVLDTCTSVLRLDVRFVHGSCASQVRCVALENGCDSYVRAPLIGQYIVSITLLTNQLFVWVYLNPGPDITKIVPSSDREQEELSIDVKHGSTMK